jgi:hypothetical protein
MFFSIGVVGKTQNIAADVLPLEERRKTSQEFHQT